MQFIIQKTIMHVRRITPALLLCTICLYAGIADAPRPATAVNDYANILSEQARLSLEQLCVSVYEKTGVAFVLAIVASLDGDDIDNAANRLYEKWGIGSHTKDEGVLVLMAMQERKIRIETGYGVEGYITDLKAAQIRRKATDEYLSKSQWDTGLHLIFYSLTELVALEKGIEVQQLIPGERQIPYTVEYDKNSTFSPLKFVFILLLIAFLLGTRVGRTLLFWMLLNSMTGSRRHTHSGGGGFGGGFGGGGFGGFGGGRSGGGGSSGGF